MKAVIYARYSSDNQREESIEGQIRECTAFAEKNGVTVLRHYIDRAFSAKTDNRRYIGEYTYRDIVVPEGIPAIVPQDLFDRVQERLAKNKKAPARHKAEDDYLLTTKLFCGYCGAYLCGESGTSHTGNTHRYYKCVSVKKKRTECHKKSVRKEWIEDLVVGETMKMVMDDKAIEAIVSMLMELQDRENVNLPLYEQQLREADIAIQNLLNAIQQGILTKSTKGRLEELEAAKEELETRIACEKLAKPKISAEFMTFWLHRFRKLDVRQKAHRKMLIDTFINAIFLYDDKMVITFNYKEGTDTVTFDDLKATSAAGKTGSDLDCLTAPHRGKARPVKESHPLGGILLLCALAPPFPMKAGGAFAGAPLCPACGQKDKRRHKAAGVDLSQFTWYHSTGRDTYVEVPEVWPGVQKSGAGTLLPQAEQYR